MDDPKDPKKNAAYWVGMVIAVPIVAWLIFLIVVAAVKLTHWLVSL